MKKFICLILLCLLFQTSYAAVTDSSNSFEIEIKEVPPGGEDNSPVVKSHSGLSDGAVAAITLGSVFGGLGALGGVGYYFFKHQPGLACGFACGEKCPYQLVGLENPEIITKSSHTYLIKAYENLKKEDGQKYLIIPDTIINPNTFNTVFFELPEELRNSKFEISQASDIFEVSKNIPELDTNIVFIPSSAKKINPSKGVLIKQGQVPTESEKVLAISTSYKTVNKFAAPKTYAIIVGFFLE